MNRVDQLTFTRFIAVVVVLFFHGGGGIYLYTLGSIYKPLYPILTSSMSAVTYLYALSGFVMVLAHYRPDEKFMFGDYWKARITRLYPLYILAFLLTCRYYGLTVTTTGFKDALANVFAVQAWFPKYAQSFNFPAWSITVEFFFYAVFPLFAVWASRRSARYLLWFALGLWAATQFIHNALWIGFFPEWIDFLIYFPLFHLSSFVLGVAGGIWFLREGHNQKINPYVNLAFLAAGVLLVCVYVVISSRNTNIPREGQLMTGFLAPFLTLSIITLSLDTTRLSALFKHPALTALGEISYAMYIFHVPVRWIYERALENSSLPNVQTIFGYTYLPLMIALGFFAAFCVDKPLRAWLKKVLQPVNLALLFIDLAILSYSIYISFDMRFDKMGRHADHYTTFLLAYWSLFVLRALFSMIFKTFTPSVTRGSVVNLVRSVFISTTAGSLAAGGIVYVGYLLNWVEFYPPSVFALDWAIMFALSLLVRYAFRFVETRFFKTSEA